ncbi:MAG: bifunctional homocysteine S-methyltransferase/methylenetetrahydrofolate reductase [Sedimentisphaerales bacterium]|nr:bifunctional homocysteine S-methyltransferase/methylenetetrahydrofolate reductase [Sedimentisphaerales bacterium]MBN2842998.1 bifunctional homocysteine S-methyltransferase/methylenetetrahydrofolate reductase [Sedimentisphaerales bacterium]
MNKEQFKELIGKRVLVGDGAMGTMLYQSGVFINACFDEINITRPTLVEDIHRHYIESGADYIETNTYGANVTKLAGFGLADKVEQINREGVRLAKKMAAGTDVLIAASVGPLVAGLSPLGRITDQEATEAYRQQIKVLADEGADFIMLESFNDPRLLILAIRAAGEVCSLPVVAQLTVNQYCQTSYGHKAEDALVEIAAEPNVDAVGFNCSIGPAIMLTALEKVKDVVAKPIIVQPNAGLPKEIEGRMLYLCTPEYMAEYSKRFFEKGARIIGGCCGTTPEHIREIARAIHSVDKADIAARVAVIAEHSKDKSKEHVPVIKLADKSKWGAKLAQGQMAVSIEITPPRGCDLTSIVDKAKLCRDSGIDAMNIPDGPRASSRMSPMITALEIQRLAGIESILHVCCRDRNIIGLQSDMMGAQAVGVKNMLMITGDPPKLGEYPDATAVFDLDAIGLTHMVKELNCGYDVAGNSLAEPLSLVLGVGANPVASELEREIERFKLKVQSGAEYVITQPIFDVKMLKEFLEATKEYRIPVIAGIWPFTSFKNAEFMANEVPGVVVPDYMLQRMSAATTREEGRELGVQIAREIVEAIGDVVDGFAISAPFGNAGIALDVIKPFMK